MDSREAFIREFGLHNPGWEGDMEAWINQLESEGGSRSAPGYFSIERVDGRVKATLYIRQNGTRVGAGYSWKLPKEASL